jgi:hypothetical protein
MAARTAFMLRRGRGGEAIALGSPRAAGYPFDLRYRRGRSGRLAFDALDAITGKRAGGPLRAAIAAALIDADRARSEDRPRLSSAARSERELRATLPVSPLGGRAGEQE